VKFNEKEMEFHHVHIPRSQTCDLREFLNDFQEFDDHPPNKFLAFLVKIPG